MDAFRRGLYESAANTGAWIISGGHNVGAMKEVGKARRQYSSAFGDAVPIIGILSWENILYKEDLIQDPGEETPSKVHLRYKIHN